MTVKDLREIVGDNDKFHFLNEKGLDLVNVDINSMLSREVIGLEIEQDMFNVTLRDDKKITMTELFKGIALECGDSLIDVLENLIECRFCPISTKCKDDGSNCQTVLSKYVELE